MTYKDVIINNFPKIWENQYLIAKNFDKEIIYYADTDEFIYWENLYHEDITDRYKKILNDLCKE